MSSGPAFLKNIGDRKCKTPCHKSSVERTVYLTGKNSNCRCLNAFLSEGTWIYPIYRVLDNWALRMLFFVICTGAIFSFYVLGELLNSKLVGEWRHENCALLWTNFRICTTVPIPRCRDTVPCCMHGAHSVISPTKSDTSGLSSDTWSCFKQGVFDLDCTVFRNK